MSQYQRYKEPLWAGFILFGVAMACAVISILIQLPGNVDNRGFIHELTLNLTSEFIGIAVTIGVVGLWFQRRDERRLLEQLSRELGAGDIGISKRAVNELRIRHWLSDGSLRGVDLTEATLSDVNLDEAYLAEANLTGAKISSSLEGANLESAWLEHAELNDVNLNNSSLKNSCLSFAKLMQINAQNCDFSGADLTGADLTHADLRNTKMHRTELGNAILTAASLEGVDFSFASGLSTAKLDNATYDERTIWPLGFDHVNAGAKRSR
jgi:uncharacterized protein YjiS (DUF1127 family)